MIISMTGFASTTTTIKQPNGNHSTLTLTIKSLNGRYFEFYCKLPPALSFYETELLKVCKQKLKRGNVVVTIQLSNPEIFRGSISPNLTLVQGYVNACKTIQTTHAIPGELNIHDLLQCSGIFSLEESSVDEITKQHIIDITNRTLDQLWETRVQEGKSIEKDLQERYVILEETIQTTKTLAYTMLEERKQRVTEKLALIKDTDQYAETYKNMLYTELDKIDINEEIVRFKDHIQTLKNTTASQELEKGRRLDFIVQELAREANTMAAKCSNADISSHAITLKVELEKVREQIQNIL